MRVYSMKVYKKKNKQFLKDKYFKESQRIVPYLIILF